MKNRVSLAILTALAMGAGGPGSWQQASGAGSNDGSKRRQSCKCGECPSCLRAIEAAKAKRLRRAINADTPQGNDMQIGELQERKQ